MSRVKIPFSGGCACGAIRYECSAEPVVMLKCHCRNCQHMTGSGFSPAVLVPAEAFRVTRGQLRYHFTRSAAGGQHKRGFCAECGSLLTGGENTERPTGVVGVTAGSLDDPSWVSAADGHFHVRRAAVGSNGSGESEIRAVSAVSERIETRAAAVRLLTTQSPCWPR